MIAVYNPFRDGLKTYKQYDIERLGGNFRSIQVLKNRFGDCDIEVGCAFYGWINYFAEIPRPECITMKNTRIHYGSQIVKIIQRTER